MYNNFLEIYRRHFDGLRVHNRYDTLPEPEEFFRISKQAYFDTKEEKAVSFLVAALYIAGNSSIILSRALAQAETAYSLTETTFSADFVMAFEDYRVSHTTVRILQLVQGLREKAWFSQLAESQEIGKGEFVLSPAIMAAYLVLADYSVPLEKTLLISGQQMGEVLKAVADSVSALSYSALEQMVYGILVNNSGKEASQHLRMNSDVCLSAYLAANLAGDCAVPVRFACIPAWRDRADRLTVAKEGMI